MTALTSAAPSATRRTPPQISYSLARAWRRTWPPLAFATVLVLLWEFLVIALGVSSYVIASPSAIAAELADSSEILWRATWVTTQEIVYGFAISIVVGMALALLVVRFALVERAVYPLIVLFQVVPKVALAPIFILWFGYSMTPKLVLIVVMAFFPITINMVLGLKRVDEDQVLLMRSVGSSKNQILGRIQLPTSLPYLFAGLRIGITLAVIGAVVAEFAGSQDGLGHLIQFASTQLDTALMFAALIVVSILGLLLYYGVGLIEWLMYKPFPHLRLAEH